MSRGLSGQMFTATVVAECLNSANDPLSEQKWSGRILPFMWLVSLARLFRQGSRVYSSGFLNIYQLLQKIFVIANLRQDCPL